MPKLWGETYKQISQAKNDAARVRLLAGIFKHADEKTLRAAAHFSLAELVEPVMSDRRSIGPATIRDQIATLAKKDPGEIENEADTLARPTRLYDHSH